MQIPPLGQSRLPPFVQSEFSPQEEIKSQLELIAQIQSQMTQNRGKGDVLTSLYAECSQTLSTIQESLQTLSPSKAGSMQGQLDTLKAHLADLFNKLKQNAPTDSVRESSAAVTTILGLLQHDLGPPRSR